MQKLCCVRTRQHPLPVWSYNLSLTNLPISQPILIHFWWELYHYFVTDRINCGEIKLQYCPTTEMIGDYFTKPLQGTLFNKFRDRVLNIQVDPSPVPVTDHRSVLGQHRSHATEQSHRQSRATTQYDQTQCPTPANKMLGKHNKQPQEEPKVHTVMVGVPMTQPVGGWHVTSRTKHHEQNVSRPCPRTWDKHNRNKHTLFNESG